MSTDPEVTKSLRVIGHLLARQQLTEAASELGGELRLLLADAPRLLLLMDRPAAEDFVDQVQTVIRLCDVVSSS